MRHSCQLAQQDRRETEKLQVLFLFVYLLSFVLFVLIYFCVSTRYLMPVITRKRISVARFGSKAGLISHMGQIRDFSDQISVHFGWLKPDLKMSRISPILGQFDPVLAQI